jgi:starch synthase
MNGMKVLHAAAECYPLAKTGGLGDVLAALPPVQRELGADARLALPAYRGVNAKIADAERVARMHVRGHDFDVIRGVLGVERTPIYLFDCPALFDRGGDPYRDERGREFADNGARFGTFSEALMRFTQLPDSDFVPDVVNLHDWQAGLAAAWFAQQPAPRPKLVFTIHNLAYQGQFDRAAFVAAGLPERFWNPAGVRSGDGLSFMRAGINLSDAITTVSPGYAEEIQTAAFGCGLEDLLRARRSRLHGIVNGVDTAYWNPQTDPFIETHYSAADVDRGKRANKQALQQELGLAAGDLPLVVFIGRLAEQKGADLIVAAGPQLLALPAHFAILASGDPALQDALRSLAASAQPGRIAVRIDHDERLAHRLTAAADLLLMPSRYEPCGLNQMYAQRYGTIPLVRRTGGLASTVTDATPESLANGSATGVMFDHADTGGLMYGVRRGLELVDDARTLAALRRAAMSRDFSCQASAKRYLALYEGLVGTSKT